jgi:hypothetical protein
VCVCVFRLDFGIVCHMSNLVDEKAPDLPEARA